MVWRLRLIRSQPRRHCAVAYALPVRHKRVKRAPFNKCRANRLSPRTRIRVAHFKRRAGSEQPFPLILRRFTKRSRSFVPCPDTGELWYNKA